MRQKNSCTFDYPIDITIKMLYFAGKLFQEHDSYDWVPGWLVGTLGINGSALGINVGKQYIVHFANQDKDTSSVKIPFDLLWCSGQDVFGNRDVPCHVFDCPVRQIMIERCGQPDQEVTCFQMSGMKGFLMACGDGLQLNSFPVAEILKAISHIIECSLDTVKSHGKAAPFFLPSEDMAQIWSEMLAGLSHDLRTPLACIKGYVTTLLREDVTWDNAIQKDFLNIIVEETDHIESLINDLLDSSTLSWKGEIELKKEMVLLPHIVNKVLKDPS